MVFHHPIKTWDSEVPGLVNMVNVYKKLLKMAIEIVDLPIHNGDFP